MSKIEAHNEKVDRSRLKLLGSLGLLAAFGALGGCAYKEEQSVRVYERRAPVPPKSDDPRDSSSGGGISAGGGD